MQKVKESETRRLTPDMTEEQLKNWAVFDNEHKIDVAAFENEYGKGEAGFKKMKQFVNDTIKKFTGKTVEEFKKDNETTTTDTEDLPDSLKLSFDGSKYAGKDDSWGVDVSFKAPDGTITSWTVTFSVNDEQPLSQVGYDTLIHTMLSDRVLYDDDRGVYWVYTGKRWMPLDKQATGLRQFALQAVDVFVGNTLRKYGILGYDLETGFYSKQSKPVKEDGEKEEDFKARENEYKATASRIKKINAFLFGMQKNPTIKQMIEDLKAVMAKSNIEWDKDDYLLNALNGVVDLRSGALLKHDKSLYLTRIAPVNYNPQAKHPVLDRTLAISFQDDSEMIDYVKRQMGYFLVGGNPNHKIMFWYGPKARNGKSVIGGTITRILGGESDDHSGYALPVPVGTFLSGKFGEDAKQADPNLANLQGVRLAVASEPDKGARLAGGKIKEITGDGTVTARHLHQDPVTFQRKFKILIMCNFMPSSDGDASIRRRVVITPFDHHIKEASLEDDPQVQSKLWKEKEGIFSWMVEGAVQNYQTLQARISKKAELIKQVQAEGKSLEDVTTTEEIAEDPLQPQPKSAVEALDGYLFSANSVTQFLHETTISKHDYWNYLFATVFRNFDADRYYEAYQTKDGKAYNQRNFDEHYFTEQKLLLLPNSFIGRSQLFKMYKNYCQANGIRNAVTAHDFYDTCNRYLVPAKTHRGYVYLGIAATPQAGDEEYHNNTINWVSAPEGFKKTILAVGYNILQYTQFGDRGFNRSLKTFYYNVDINKNQKISTVQLNKLYRAVKNDSNLYFGRMVGTLNPDSIDFDKQLKILKDRGVDYSKDDNNDSTITDEDRNALFG